MAGPWFGIPPHSAEPSGAMHAWWTDPPGMVDAPTGERMTAPMVDWLTGPATAALLARFPAQPLWFIHDWRGVTSYDMSARAKLVAWGLGLGRRHVAGIIILLGPGSPALVRMACQAGVVPFAVAGIEMCILEDPAAVVQRLKLRAAA